MLLAAAQIHGNNNTTTTTTTHINTTTTDNQNQDWGATNKNYPKPEKGCLRPLQSFPITNFPIAVLTVLNHFTKTLVTKMSKK